MNNKKRAVMTELVIAIVVFVFFIVYTMLVAKTDVQPIGPEGSEIGFASMNSRIADKLGYNATLYKVSEILGYLALLQVAGWGVLGLVQLIKGKSLKLVDVKLYALAVGYAVMLGCYVFFEKVIVNYRPVIIDAKEGLEASYPSSHTVLSLFVCMSSMLMFSYYIKDKKIRMIANIVVGILMVAIILFRFLSGAHWASDIVGSLLLGSALVSAFATALLKLE